MPMFCMLIMDKLLVEHKHDEMALGREILFNFNILNVKVIELYII